MKSPLQVLALSTNDENSFAAKRKYDIHTGIDLIAPPKTPVFAIEAGVCVKICWFTGRMAESPWWRDTRAVMIEGETGVFLYGEIRPNPQLCVGDKVKAGDELGWVVRVLKRDKGLPTSMLHLELYTHGTREPVWWYHNEPKPVNLIDPSKHIFEMVRKTLNLPDDNML
jgi:murein DD-endopeptidase MepM/ murein hydrolase activator NlpD